LLGFSLILPFSAAADEREEPIDVIIALDKSKSMAENDKIEAVKEYMNSYIIDELLIEGDFFLVVAFYGQTEIPISTTIQSDEDKERAKAIIAQMLGDGVYTDIGNALDVLGQQVEKYARPDRKKHLLLITDGIQEAPPDSKYYSPDGSFNHAFLENSKIIQKQGWKIHILGIGAGSAAKELAETLSGTYTEVEEEPSPEEIAEETRDILGTIVITAQPQAKAFSRGGKSSLELRLESSGYDESKTIRIRRLSIQLDGREQILAEGIDLEVTPASENLYTITLS